MRLAKIPFIFLFISLPIFAYGPSQKAADSAIAGVIDSQIPATFPLIDLRRSSSLDDLVKSIDQNRAVFVGETHADYAHHLLQLSVIKKLHQAGVDLAIGMEMFQRPQQKALNRYINGDTNEQEMLKETEWFDRWKYDYRLYRPILNFSAEQKIPIVALNAPQEVVAQVSESGLAGLSDAGRKAIPDAIDFTDKAYQGYLESIFSMHGSTQRSSFNRFVEVQLLWDETMAETAANYLKSNSKKVMVILAGVGHIQRGYGIPNRLERRMDIETLSIVPMSQFDFDLSVADFVVFPGNFKLPSAGLMGIYMTESGEGVRVSELLKNGAADAQGLKEGDIVRQIDQAKIGTAADVKLALLDKVPGDKIKIVVSRHNFFGFDQEINLDLSLGGDSK